MRDGLLSLSDVVPAAVNLLNDASSAARLGELSALALDAKVWGKPEIVGRREDQLSVLNEIMSRLSSEDAGRLTRAIESPAGASVKVRARS